MKSLGQLLDTIKINPGEIPPSDVKQTKPSSGSQKTDSIGIYVPEPLNDKKLYGANIDVLHTLDTIEFNKYADGALKQNIAYIKFWGDTKVSPDIVSKEIFKDIELDSEQTKCFELKDSSECKLSVSNTFTYPGVEAVEQTQEVGKSFSDLTPVTSTVFNPDSSNFKLDKTTSPFKTYDANFAKYVYDLPDELKALIPIVPKPPTLIQQGQAGLSAIQELKKQGQAYIQKGRELLLGTPGAKPILDTIGTVESLLNEVDKIFRISGTVLNKTGQVIDIWENIREANDVDLDITFTDPIIEKPETLDIPLSTPVLGYGLDISIDEPIFSADVKGAENISTYSCKEVLSKKDGIWQFMFNPSQLAYTYASDYAISDVWATPDGKPMHWKGNNNPELQFSDILLNGYMFGRKVEYLAQGLKDLMGFSGPTYQGSPPVLEFVWGSKTFGPCVMKNLSVTENMWDAGDLVGATCSFTLVAVPEWTVNDGQVDIFDPSRTPVFIPRTPDEAPATEATTGDSTLEGGSAAPETNSEEPIVTIKDPPKIGNAPGLVEYDNKSPLCVKVFSQDANIKNSNFLYSHAVKEIAGLQSGTNADEAVKFLSRDNGPYGPWFRAIEAVTKIVGIPVLAPNSSSMIESFKKVYPKCFYPNNNLNSETYGMISLNIQNNRKSKTLDAKGLQSAMLCRMDLIRYITDTYSVKCSKVKGKPAPPVTGGNLDVTLCSFIEKTNGESKRLLRYATSGFPNGPVRNIPLDKLSNLYNGLDTLLRIGLYNSKQVNLILSNRKDLQGFYNTYTQTLNKTISSASAITPANSSCVSIAEKLRNVSGTDPSYRNGLTMTSKELINLVNTFNGKCFSPMLNLGNKAVKDKVIRCEKK